ncbi:MAG: hypothetical protein ABSA23_05385 [Anaerolineales bacterium]
MLTFYLQEKGHFEKFISIIKRITYSQPLIINSGLRQYNGAVFFLPEAILSRVINPDSAGKERTRLTKGIVLAIRELAKQSEPGAKTRDLAAYIALALSVIAGTIDVSVAAWEKRDYWVKADKFRMKWAWSGQYAEKMKLAILENDWANVARVAAQTAQKLSKVTVSPGHRLGRPWEGAWVELKKK